MMEPARAQLMQTVCGGWISAAVAAAARFKIADHLAAEPLAVEELAARTGAAAKPLELMMRALAAVGLFTLAPQGCFGNSAQSEHLRSDHPYSMRNFSILAGELYQQSFAGLADSLVSSQSPFRGLFGSLIYDHLERNPELAEIYDQAMEEVTRPVGAHLAMLPVVRQARQIVDIGGGRGGLLNKVIADLPLSEGVVFDRPDVCDRARLGNQNPRLRFVGGDFFDGLPVEGDCFILKNVLHNWGEENCRKILGGIATALAKRPGSTLLVLEPLAGVKQSNLYGALNDLMQFVICEDGAAMRTAAEMETLLASAGLRMSEWSIFPTGHALFTATLAG